VEEAYWNDWNKGCKSTEEEILGQKGDKSDAQKIAHVWKSILNGSESEETWERVKKSFNDSEHNLSKQITQALDLYFATKNDSPLTVLKVSNNLATDNILWGWAQSAAIKRYGDTWTGILPLESRNHAESLDLNEENIDVKPKIKRRELATVKKKRVSNTKSKKANSKKSSKSKS
jgi:hypothetical protein